MAGQEKKYSLPQLLVRCLLENKDGQWLAFSLEFGLAAQADTLADAKTSLERMIVSYLYDALIGEDREHAAVLVRRRARSIVYAKYYYTAFRSWLVKRFGGDDNSKRTYLEPVPLAPHPKA